MKTITIQQFNKYLKVKETDNSISEFDINVYPNRDENVKQYNRRLENWLLEKDIRFTIQNDQP